MRANALIRETSPYLLQHARNPVDWRPWGAAALREARDLGRPIFLSIGYSSCHWCHVMAHESFEDEEIAGVMNESFVNIKVDREERPDIDDIYQRACQAATGQGGWPLSAFLAPDCRPYFVGTYFPPLDSHGRPGFGSLCRRMAQAWRESPGDVERAARRLAGGLEARAAGGAGEPSRDALDEAAVNLMAAGDPVHGGFGSAPKFPSTACVSFLLRYSDASGVRGYGEFALRTLRKMARGGIFDQVGGGFHRYSTDARWLVPHFEKMLYDNALIPANYAEAYQATGDPLYLRVMERTLDFVLRDMRGPGGGLYSALDADTEEGEGKYYTWTKAEIRDVLGGDAEMFCLYHGATDGGNWEGRNILCGGPEMPAVAFRFGVTEAEARGTVESCAARLLEARRSRPAPGLDTKVLASWNALAASALARGHRVSGERGYLEAAESCLGFIRGRMWGRGRLAHSYGGGAPGAPGFLEDYAFLANALLDAFGHGADPERLGWASEIAGILEELFWDPGSGTFFMTSAEHERLIARPRNVHDLSVPSGNSAAAMAMLRLHRITGEPGPGRIARRALAAQARAAAENPFAFGHALCAASAYLRPGEVLVLNTENRRMCGYLRRRYLPDAELVEVDDPARLGALSGLPLFAGKEVGGSTAVVACDGASCSAPMRTQAELESRFSRG